MRSLEPERPFFDSPRMTTDQLRWAGFGPSDLRAPLVGRQSELAALEAALEVVQKEKKPRIVSVVGPAGVGKSRLVYEFFARLPSPDEAEQEIRVHRASARDTTAVYGVFARLLRGRFGLLETMDAEAQKALVRAQVASVLEDRKVGDVLYFLGQLLDLPFPGSPLTNAVADDPVQARLLRRSVLRHLLEADAAQSPLALVLEDLDGAHEDAIELLVNLVANITAPILFVCIARSDVLGRFETVAKLGDRLATIEPGPLGDAEARTVMEALLEPCGDPPPELVDHAVELAGGNPMLLEKMVRVYHDTGVLQALSQRAWSVHLDALERVRLPMTVEDAVEARIAALTPSERRLLERAAAMGSVFWVGGLLALERASESPPDVWDPAAEGDLATVREALQDLVDRDYLLGLPDSSFSGEEEFVFKHNKERERISQLTGAADAKRFHHVIAEWLEHKAQVTSHEEHMGMLARHRELAGDMPRAARAYIEAGGIARERYANQKAAEYYQRGLELLGDGDMGRRIDALHHYGDVLQTLGKIDEALAIFLEMKALAWKLDLVAKGGAAHNRIGRLYRDVGKLEDAQKHLSAGLALFEAAGDERGIASSIDDMAKLAWLRGDYARAMEEMRRALQMRRRIGDRRSIAVSLNNLGLVLQDSGQYKEALEMATQALQIRREIGDLLGVVTSLNNLGTIAQDQHDHARALALFQEAYGVAKEIGERNRLALLLTNIGETHYRLGHPEQAIEILKEAEGLCDELGDKLGLAEAVRGLGKAYLIQGDLAKARVCIARAVDLFTAVKSKVHLGIALRTLAEVTAAGGWGAEHTGKAGDYFRQAIAIFQEIGNEVELARAFRAYATFLQNVPGGMDAEAAKREAAHLEKRALEIFARLNVSAAQQTRAAHVP